MFCGGIRAISECDGAAAGGGGERKAGRKLYDYLMMSASGSLHYDEGLADQQRAQMGRATWRRGGEAGFEMQRYGVRTVSIDDCLDELGVARVELVKMDIEGRSWRLCGGCDGRSRRRRVWRW